MVAEILLFLVIGTVLAVGIILARHTFYRTARVSGVLLNVVVADIDEELKFKQL